MIFVSYDPLAYGMAGLALMLSLVALLFIVFYVRKLALAASSLARDFYTVLEANGYFDEDEEADGDARDSDESDDSGDDEPTPPSDPNATALLPTSDVEVSEDEEEALLHVILHRDERRDYNSLSML